jgi:AcrR family transcriptional regulator
MYKKALPTTVKNKEQTKRKLIQAVGEIIKISGYTGLGINKIARRAGVDKQLIYRYFGNVNYLIECYVIENDYWMTFSDKFKGGINPNNDSNIEALITGVLQNNFKYFHSEVEMQRLILWEISTSNPLMKGIHNARENMASEFLELTDPYFKGSSINFRSIFALLVGGIYYTILHTRYNGGIFCDIDINSEEGKAEINKTIKQVIGWAFQSSEIEMAKEKIN